MPYFEDLLDQLNSMQIRSKNIDELKKINTLIGKLNLGLIKDRISAYKSILDIAKKSGAKHIEGVFLQADLNMNCETNTLAQSIKQDLKAALTMLLKLSRTQNRSLMDNFRDAFSKRYEMREIPLSIALDTETGPGYLSEDRNANASPLLEGLVLPNASMKTKEISCFQQACLLMIF